MRLERKVQFNVGNCFNCCLIVQLSLTWSLGQLPLPILENLEIVKAC